MDVINVLVFISFIINAKALELDNLFEYVVNKTNEIATYQLPTNNEKVFHVNDSIIHDYGNFDFIIVGAGAGGAVMANRLSEIRSWKVLLLEAGGKSKKYNDIPMFTGRLGKSDMNWGYLTVPQSTWAQGMKNKQGNYPRGKVIGGSTTLNGGVYSRGSSSDYDQWANTVPGWSYKDVLPFFEKSEHVLFSPYDIGYHGKFGPVYVNHTSPPSNIANAYLRANLEKGLKIVDYNGIQQVGVSRAQSAINGNIHQNSEHSFLDSIKNRKNLKILLNAGVNKLLLKGARVEGVTFVQNGTTYRVKANKEVILSAGAINSPQLLMLSGIGPQQHLETLEIPVVKHLPAVGEHLQDHPMFVNLFVRTNLTFPNNTLKEDLKLYLEGKTPLTNGGNIEHLTFFNENDISRGNANIELLTFPPPYSVPNPKVAFNLGDEFSDVFKKYNTLTDLRISVCLMKPKSVGKVTLKSKNILDFPLIDPNFFSDQNGEDIEAMYKGIKYVLSLLNTKAFRRVNATLISEQPNCDNLKHNSTAYWYCAIRIYTSSEYHPASTARMGTSENDSVVDENCIVHGFQNLRVVDAGVMPNIPRGHLMAIVYMIAEKISNSIKKRYGLKCAI